MATKDNVQEFAEQFMASIGKDFSTLCATILNLLTEALTLGAQVHTETISALENLQDSSTLSPEDRARIGGKIEEAKSSLARISAHCAEIEALQEALHLMLMAEEA